MEKLSRWIDSLSAFLAARKGLLPIFGLMLIVVNLLLQFLSPGWLAESNLLLHLGIILAILGFMLAWAL